MKLEFIVFISGAVVMAYELAAARLLAPHLGSSLHTWTSIIGVILLSLSLGYWYGGKRADREPDTQALRRILFRAAALIVVTAIFQEVALSLLRQAPLDIRLTTVLASLLLFSPASVYLGMVSPYAAKLRLADMAHSGATVGRLYAVSTTGSIFGTFITGFYLLAWLGSSQILALLAGLLLFCGLLLSRLPRAVAAGLAVVASTLGYVALQEYDRLMSGGRIDIDTGYNRIWILEGESDGRRLRYLHTHAFTSQSVVDLDQPDDLVLPYAQLMLRIAQSAERPQRALIIGGAGCSLPRALIKQFPDAQVDVVEIDPDMTEVAKAYFFLQDDSPIQFFHEDGRTFINRDHTPYDIILVDAYDANLTLPFHLATAQAMARYSSLLAPGGVFAMNTIAAEEGPGSELLNSIWKTLDRSLPLSQAIASRQPSSPQEILNVVLIAAKDDLAAGRLASHLREYGNRRLDRVGRARLPLLTDDYAPVEHYALRGLPEWIKRRREAQQGL